MDETRFSFCLKFQVLRAKGKKTVTCTPSHDAIKFANSSPKQSIRIITTSKYSPATLLFFTASRAKKTVHHRELQRSIISLSEGTNGLNELSIFLQDAHYQIGSPLESVNEEFGCDFIKLEVAYNRNALVVIYCLDVGELLIGVFVVIDIYHSKLISNSASFLFCHQILEEHDTRTKKRSPY